MNSSSQEEKKSNEEEIPKFETIVKQPSGSRTMITKMVLENFKSYAGKQEVGPFHHVNNYF